MSGITSKNPTVKALKSAIDDHKADQGVDAGFFSKKIDSGTRENLKTAFSTLNKDDKQRVLSHVLRKGSFPTTFKTLAGLATEARFGAATFTKAVKNASNRGIGPEEMSGLVAGFKRLNTQNRQAAFSSLIGSDHGSVLQAIRRYVSGS